MALAHFTLPPPPPPTSPISSSPPISSFPSPILPSKNAQSIASTPTTIGRGRLPLPPPRRRSNRFSSCFPLRSSSSSSLDTVGPTPTVGQVTEVTKDTFWPIVNSAGDKTVVLDMYTQWCGPCKVIAPKFQQLSEKYLDVVFLKLDCNQENKPLAKELGIRVVPTFKILKDSKIVKEVTGAKFDDLALAIETVRSS